MTEMLRVVMADPPPVSVNRMYGIGQGGRRFLTKEGSHFKESLASAVAKETMNLPWKSCAIEEVYERGGFVTLDMTLTLSSVLNNSWVEGGSSTKKGNPRSPYQRIDTTNYLKLVEDAVAIGTGIDDANHLLVTSTKRGGDTPSVGIVYHVFPRSMLKEVTEWDGRPSSFRY